MPVFGATVMRELIVFTSPDTGFIWFRADGCRFKLNTLKLKSYQYTVKYLYFFLLFITALIRHFYNIQQFLVLLYLFNTTRALAFNKTLLESHSTIQY